jgi:hypothetical protein
MRAPLVTLALLALACAQPPNGFSNLDAKPLYPARVLVEPAPGVFNGSVTVTLTTDRVGGVVYVSTEGRDPRTSSVGRLQGTRVSVTLERTSTLRYFVSVPQEPDSELTEGTWTRASGTSGTISGVLVVGAFAVGKQLGLSRNGQTRQLAPVDRPTEIPFRYTGLASGTYQLRGIVDRDDDGLLLPLIDFEGDTVSVEVKLDDPAKAGPEGIRVYLGASRPGLGALTGIITLPKPPLLQQLRLSVLNFGSLGGGGLGGDPTQLLQQLQSGYQVFTNANETEYRYYIGDLMPGSYTPVPALIGFGAGGVAFNLLANPLRPTMIVADQVTTQNFAFGPVTLTGRLTLPAAPTGGLPVGVVAGRVVSLTNGIQAVLMPALVFGNGTSAGASGGFGGEAFLGNTSIALRGFSGAQGIIEALTWVINPFGGAPPHATVSVQQADVTQDIVVP